MYPNHSLCLAITDSVQILLPLNSLTLCCTPLDIFIQNAVAFYIGLAWGETDLWTSIVHMGGHVRIRYFRYIFVILGVIHKLYQYTKCIS